MIKSILVLPFKLINYIVLLINNAKYKKFPLIYGIILLSNKGEIRLGVNVKINSLYLANPVGQQSKTHFVIKKSAKIIINNNVGISNSLFYCRNKIEIEDNVLIGGGCQILDNDFHSLDLEKRMSSPDTDIKSAPIIIKNGAFIGANSIVLKGVTIGVQSIVAAGSVVTKSIPDYQIWGGNPAKFIRNISRE